MNIFSSWKRKIYGNFVQIVIWDLCYCICRAKVKKKLWNQTKQNEKLKNWKNCTRFLEKKGKDD